MILIDDDFDVDHDDGNGDVDHDDDNGDDVDDDDTDVDDDTDDAGGTARRRLGRTWSARSCRWCWRRLRRRTPRKRCTKSRAIASRSSSPTSSGWCNGWTTGDVTTTRAHDTNCDFRILLCTCIERRSCLCLYLPVVFVEYIFGYLDFIASHTTAVVDTREGMWSCSTAVRRIQCHLQRSVRGEANPKEEGDGVLVANMRYCLTIVGVF